jgi:hypothetical protein
MGKRSRKRGDIPAPVREQAPRVSKTAPARLDRRARMDEAPKAPWSPFPLTELSILIALVLLTLGLLRDAADRGPMIGAGVGLLSLAAGELALREHFAGYRSHSGLLSAIVAILIAAPLYLLTPVPPEVIFIAAAVTFAAAFKLLRDEFSRRTGGLTFRA